MTTEKRLSRHLSWVGWGIVLNVICICVTIEGGGDGHESQDSVRRFQKRFSIFRRSDSKNQTNATTPVPNSSRGTSRARKFSAEEHAQRFAQYEKDTAKDLIQNFLQQSALPTGSDRARMADIPNVISYHDGETIATIRSDSNGNISSCSLFEIKNLAESDRILAQFAVDNNRPVQKISFRTMLTMITACQAIDPTISAPHSLESTVSSAEVDRPPPLDVLSMRTVISGILPGTKWCGLGDIAQDYGDLGQEKDLDKCCRAHDHCPTKLRSFRRGYGLINWSLYTKSHCDCDSLLYECLKRAGGQTADLLGTFYFNVLKVQCIDEESPPKCSVRGRNNTCRTWGPSPSADKVMFFSDVRRQF